MTFPNYRTHQIGLIFVFGVGLAFPAQASTILFDNILNGSIGNRGLATTSQYQSFSTGAGGFSLGEVDLALLGNVSANSFSVDLYADSSTAPGSLLDHIATMNDSLLLTGLNIYDFSIAGFSLAANTRYWIGIKTSNGSSVDWSIEGPFQHFPPTEIGTTGEFIDDTGIVSGDNGEAFQMRLISAASSGVPEPASLLLSAAGLSGLALFCRFKRGA